MSNPITELSNAITSVVESVRKSVVKVEAGRWMGSTGIVWSSGGHILAAAHTLKRSDVQVVLPGGQEVSASVVGRDPSTDIALLKAEADSLTPPNWAEPEGLRVGQIVLAVGWPGKNLRATMGVLSNLGEEWHTPMGGKLKHYIQPDISMYPGFSGGPLLDDEGRVLGMNTQALRRGLTLTLSVPTLKQVVQRIQKQGNLKHGYLGVSAQAVRLPEGAGQEVGLLLVSVEPDSPAAKGGLMLGDVLLAINTQPLRRVHHLLEALSELPAGTQVGLKVWRGGQMREIQLVLGER